MSLVESKVQSKPCPELGFQMVNGLRQLLHFFDQGEFDFGKGQHGSDRAKEFNREGGEMSKAQKSDELESFGRKNPMLLSMYVLLILYS